MKENPLSQFFQVSNSHFAYCGLFGLSQGTIFTWFEGTSDLNTHCFSGDTGNYFQRAA